MNFCVTYPISKVFKIHQVKKRRCNPHTTIIPNNRINATFRTDSCMVTAPVIIQPFNDIFMFEDTTAIKTPADPAVPDLLFITESTVMQSAKIILYFFGYVTTNS
ncbi:MAG: hypothetical protein IKO59_06550 [Bacteroidales bacterium]|nr:hypothetical protein [Bacteroidales bacterium]